MARDERISRHTETAGTFFRTQAAALTFAGLAFGLGAIGLFVPAKEGPVVGISIGIGGGVAGFGCLIWAVIAYNGLVRAVTLYEDRVEWTQGGSTHAADWEEIGVVWRAEVYVNGSLSVREVTIKAGRDSATFPYYLSDWKGLAETIQEHTFPHLWAEAAGAFNAGEKVKFGPQLAVARGGLTVEGKPIAWEDVRGMAIRNGYLVITSRKSEHHLSLGETPNFHVLLSLLEKCPVRPG